MLSRRLPTQLCSSSSRSFSASASAHRGVTSNVGKRPIPIPDTVTLTPSPTSLTVTGPRGTTSVPLESYMALTNPEPSVLTIAVQDSTVKKQRQMWGLTRTLISNAVTGMTENFTTPVNLVGVGYRAALEADPRAVEEGHQGSGQRLNMKLGYSHSVFVPIPAHIKAEVPSATQIILSCNDKHQLGLFAAKVREWRKPEPYKGKGIFVGNEQIRIKQVKKK